MTRTFRFIALWLAAIASTAQAEKLSVARIFSAPDLGGPQLTKPSISPDGKYIAYLQGKADNKDELDLWGFDVKTGRASILIDSRKLLQGNGTLSDEEAARRERQRTASLRGIVEYEFSADGRRLLVPLGGDLYLYDLGARSSERVKRLTSTSAYETDARFSPKGRYVSFIRDQNLFVIEIATGTERALTRDGKGLISFGTAEFIAQEEMDRDTGYWWAPDDSKVAFTRVDESPIHEIERSEIYADRITTVKQRYPSAGSRNAAVELNIIDVNTAQVVKVDLGVDPNIYIPRVDWFPDAQSLAVQRESRNQQRLELLKVDAQNGDAKILIAETSATWINLGDNLVFVPGRRAFVWASERSGFRHLYLYSDEGEYLRALTAGEWCVTGDLKPEDVAAKRGLIFFSANQTTPLDQQLFVTSLDTTNPASVRRVSRETGWHEAVMIKGQRGYLDTFSSADEPPSVAIRNVDGSLNRWVLQNSLDSTHPYFAFTQDRANVEFGTLTASDGQRLFYRIMKPKQLVEGKRYPVIFDLYGGPGNQYVQNKWMGGGRGPQGYFRELLVQRGYVVFSLDNRGSARRGTAFEAPLYRRLGKAEVEDQVRGAAFLKSLPFIDAERIGVMGWSYGGFMTLMTLMNAPSTFKAGVAGAPVTDWRLYDTHYTERYLGDPTQNGSGYIASSVAPYVKNLKGRLLLVHGMADDNVLFANSTQLMKQLQDANIQFDLMTYPGGKHGLIRQLDMGPHYFESVIQFFKERL